MRFFKPLTNEQIVTDISNNICGQLLNGHYTDSQISDIILNVKARSLQYLDSRREILNYKMQENINSIKKLNENS